MECAPKKTVEEHMQELSNEQKKLLYMIGLYSIVKNTPGSQWLKDLSLRGLISKGIRNGIFDYDYAPASIMYRGSRKVINISQEGQNDLVELRSQGLVLRLRLGTSRHFYFNAFNLSEEEGVEVFEAIPEELRREVDELVYCNNCHKLYEIVPVDESDFDEWADYEELEPPTAEDYASKREGIYLICHPCKLKINTRLDWIEAVKYKCVPKWPKIRMIIEWEQRNRRVI